jgi:membrane-bound ClpP family serine protease
VSIEFVDEPAVVILAAAASAILLLLEVALPTVGLAGTAGLAFGALAVWGVDRQHDDWWPLAGVVAAVAVWGALIALHRAKSPGAVAAGALFLAGSLGYAVSTSDWPAAATAIVTTAVLMAAFGRIAAAAVRLTGAQPAVGLESYVGTTATVLDWSGTRGRVVSAGTSWSASGPGDLTSGDEVVVVGATGLLLEVEHIQSRHG